jgi:hypothetical protein
MRHTEETDKVFLHSYYFENGSMHPGHRPRLGVDIDERLAAQYPYERAYLRPSIANSTAACTARKFLSISTRLERLSRKLRPGRRGETHL